MTNQANIVQNDIARAIYLVDANGNPITSTNALAVNATFSASSIAINDPTTTANKATVDGSGNLHVAIAGSLAAGTNVIGALVANQSVNLAQVGSSTVSLGQTTMTGSIPVVMASNQSAVPISAASLPLPTGAATSAKQPALGTAGSASSDVITVQGVTSMTPIKTDGSGVTQPISGTITANIGASDGTNLQQLLVESSSNRNLRTAIYNGTNELGVDSGGRVTGVMQAVAGTALAADQSNTELRTSLYGKNSTAGDTALKVNSSGDQYVLGDFTEQASLSAGSLNADLVASVDVSAYKCGSLALSGTWTGTITFQWSNDNVNFNTLTCIRIDNGFNATSATSNIGVYIPIFFRYLRIRMTAYTSGTANGTLELYTFAQSAILNIIQASQSGTWTVQPGNTANTTPWLESIHDGTNKANVLPATSVSNAASSQGALLTAGAFAEQASLSSGSLNADLVASTDVSNYKEATLQITGAWSGTLTFQGSNDNSNFNSVVAFNMGSGSTPEAPTTTSNSIYKVPLGFRYLRVRMTSYTSGTANGTLELYTASSFPSLPTTVQPGNTQNTTPWLVNTPSSDITVFASGAQTATQTQADQTNNTAKGIKVVLDMTNVGSSPSVTLEIDGKDAASGKYYSILTGAAVTTVSTNVYTIYPGLTASANAVANDVLPHTWRIKVAANNSNSGTYSVGTSLLP